MAIYHTSIKTFSRAKGKNAVAAAAYRAGLNLVDENGERHDYRRRGNVEATICVAPKGSPDWATKPEELWVRASVAEKRRDATVCREFLVALPHELDADQRLALVDDLCNRLVERYQFAVQASIHTPRTREGLNWHVHILATTRRMTLEGLGMKTRELDGPPAGRIEVRWVREMVAERINAHLASAGISERVDHRRLDVQSKEAEAKGDFVSAVLLAREPTRHLGKSAAAMMRRGQVSRRGEQNDLIRQQNKEDIRERLEDLEKLGLLMSTPPGHSEAVARRERQAAERKAEQPPVRKPSTPQSMSPRARRPRTAPAPAGLSLVRPQRDSLSKSEREREIERWMLEAMRCWLEGISEAVRQSHWAVELLLAQREELIRQYGHRVSLHRDCEELHGTIRRLRKNQLQWPTSLEKLTRAQMELNRARLELHEPDPKPTVLAIWDRRAWAQRRRVRESHIADRKRVRDLARDATGPEAQSRYVREEAQTVAELKRLADRMISAYPIAAAAKPAATEPPPIETGLEEQEHGKGRRSPRRPRRGPAPSRPH